MLTVSDGPGTAAVPDVEGLTRKQARGRGCSAPASGARAQESRATTSRRARRSARRRRAASQASVGATVTLVISTGPEQVAVPTWSASYVEDARASSRRAGFVVDVSREESDDDEPGTVIEQEPGSGQRGRRGLDASTLAVAEEPTRSRCPTSTGQTRADAGRGAVGGRLRGADVEDRAVDSPEDDGVVQSPAPGRRAARPSAARR